MKKKISLNGDSIKQFFLENGEKIALGITVVVLVLFISGAFGAKPLPGTKPNEILQQARSANDQIDLRKWPDEKSNNANFKPIDFAARVQGSMAPVAEANLAHSREWDKRLFPDLIKRADPEIFAPQELQIAGGVGIVPYLQPLGVGVGGAPGIPAAPARSLDDGAGPLGIGGGTPENQKIDPQAQLPGVRAPGADPQAKYYAIITGLVPLEKQAAEYKRRFEFAVKDQDPQAQPNQVAATDVPRYRFFFVERAEVQDAKDTKLNWQPLDYKAATADIPKWAVQYPDIVDPRYVFPYNPTDAENTYITWPLPPLYLKNWGLEASHPKIPLVKLTMAEDAQPGALPNVPFDPLNPNRGPVGEGVRPGLPGGPVRGGVPSYTGEGDAMQADVPYRLFRFVDLTGEPGKTYRYRVQLLVHNPNYNMRPQFLEKADSAKDPWRRSAWSEPTPPVTLPREYRILAESVNSGRPPQELVAKFGVLSVLKNPVVEALKSFDLNLGGVAFFSNVTLDNVVDMSLEEIRKVGPVTINTNLSLLLDVRNDDPLGATKTAGPTEMVFIDNDGRLVVSSTAAEGMIQKDFIDRTTVPVQPGVGGFGDESGPPLVKPPAGGLLDTPTPRPLKRQSRATDN